MKIAVIGLGYVGLANSLALAQNHEVFAYDIDKKRIELLKQGKSPIQEKGINDFLQRKLHIKFTKNFDEAVANAEYILIATPTDYDSGKNYFDTSSVDGTIDRTLKTNPHAKFIIKSTVPVGYTEELRQKYRTKNIIFSPEFLREGKALEDVIAPTRIIVGDKSTIGKKIARIFLDAASKPEPPVLLTASTEAEAIKLFANTYLAKRIAFFNELDTYAIHKNLNPTDIITGVCLDPRIGNHYNNPSFGYGGYCLPKDTKQLLANFANIPNNLIAAIVESNKTRKEFIAQQIMNKNPRTVGIYRLAMKSGSGNFRESSILDIIKILKNATTDVIIYEPILSDSEFSDCKVEKDLAKFKAASDLIVANRMEKGLLDVTEKVYTRDLFGDN